MPLTISVIIPTLNEAAEIEAAVRSSFSEGADEVVVVDGGSRDETESIALASGACVRRSVPAQRARQMNAGAAASRGDFLVFLHADTRFLPGALEALRRAAADASLLGGGFSRRYDSPSSFLRVSSTLGNLRAAGLGWVFGDQAIFVRREVFTTLGGFPERPMFEDLDFTRRIRTCGRMHLVAPGVRTSARRFRDGILRRSIHDFLLTVTHVCLDPSP